jgi:pimeloyl-ACP methyl ester carboxylesterase
MTSSWTYPADLPAWFQRAIETPAESKFASAAGARVHYLAWNEHEREKPPLLFLHGMRGHARWWSFIAPYFSERYRVFALDFSGMGQSEGRAEFNAEIFLEDIKAVIQAEGGGPFSLVAHSFGGTRALRLCAEEPALITQAIILDSYVHFPALEKEEPFITPRPRRFYPTYAEARARYRLTPAEHAAAPYIIDYLAHHSIEQVPGGFRWLFADNLGGTLIERDGPAMLARIQVPVICMHGAMSRVTRSGRAQRIVDHIPGARGSIAIPEAHHHLMLDQPLALVAALRTVLF